MRRAAILLLAVLVAAIAAGDVYAAGRKPRHRNFRARRALPPAQRVLWRPAPGTSWQIQLQGTLDTSHDVGMYDVDLFDVPQATMDILRSRGARVVCYFSAGSWEDWRPDAASFPTGLLGQGNGWPGERWLDVRAVEALAPIMRARLDLAAAKRCDAVDADNVDGWANTTGFPLAAGDQLRYNRWLAAEAHLRGLSIGLKNDLAQVEALADEFDFAVNEQCHAYDECALLRPFVERGKAVFGIEYSLEAAAFCPAANGSNFDFLKKNLDLGAARVACR